MSPFHDWFFWFAVAGATCFRVISAPLKPLKNVVTGAFGGIFSAVVFTDPLLARFNMDPDTYKVAVAAILTIIGESLLRLIMSVARDPKKGIDLWKAWRK